MRVKGVGETLGAGWQRVPGAVRSRFWEHVSPYNAGWDEEAGAIYRYLNGDKNPTWTDPFGAETPLSHSARQRGEGLRQARNNLRSNLEKAAQSGSTQEIREAASKRLSGLGESLTEAEIRSSGAGLKKINTLGVLNLVASGMFAYYQYKELAAGDGVIKMSLTEKLGALAVAGGNFALNVGFPLLGAFGGVVMAAQLAPVPAMIMGAVIKGRGVQQRSWLRPKMGPYFMEGAIASNRQGLENIMSSTRMVGHEAFVMSRRRY